MKNYKLIWLGIFCCLQPLILFAQRGETIRKAFLDPKSDRVLVVAHRGNWRSAPENSVAAIDSAIQMGVDIVEIDIHKTKDGQLILMHDDRVDRTGRAQLGAACACRALHIRQTVGVDGVQGVSDFDDGVAAALPADQRAGNDIAVRVAVDERLRVDIAFRRQAELLGKRKLLLRTVCPMPREVWCDEHGVTSPFRNRKQVCVRFGAKFSHLPL